MPLMWRSDGIRAPAAGGRAHPRAGAALGQIYRMAARAPRGFGPTGSVALEARPGGAGLVFVFDERGLAIPLAEVYLAKVERGTSDVREQVSSGRTDQYGKIAFELPPIGADEALVYIAEAPGYARSMATAMPRVTARVRLVSEPAAAAAAMPPGARPPFRPEEVVLPVHRVDMSGMGALVLAPGAARQEGLNSLLEFRGGFNVSLVEVRKAVEALGPLRDAMRRLVESAARAAKAVIDPLPIPSFLKPIAQAAAAAQLLGALDRQGAISSSAKEVFKAVLDTVASLDGALMTLTSIRLGDMVQAGVMSEADRAWLMREVGVPFDQAFGLALEIGRQNGFILPGVLQGETVSDNTARLAVQARTEIESAKRDLAAMARAFGWEPGKDVPEYARDQASMTARASWLASSEFRGKTMAAMVEGKRKAEAELARERAGYAWLPLRAILGVFLGPLASVGSALSSSGIPAALMRADAGVVAAARFQQDFSILMRAKAVEEGVPPDQARKEAGDEAARNAAAAAAEEFKQAAREEDRAAGKVPVKPPGVDWPPSIGLPGWLVPALLVAGGVVVLGVAYPYISLIAGRR